jgi:hypothetical protein
MDENKAIEVEKTDDAEEKLLEKASQLVERAIGILEKDDDVQDVSDDPNGEAMEEVDPMAGEQIAKESEEAKEEKEEAEEKKEDEKESDAEEIVPEATEKTEPESDDELRKSYEATLAKMQERGLIEKPQAPAPKAEPKAEVKPDLTQDLKKTFDEKFDKLFKAFDVISKRVDAIAKQPTGRRGVTATSPLAKSEEAAPEQPIRKGQAVKALLKAQAEGDTEVTPILVGKVETGRPLTKSEFEKVKSLVQSRQ